MGLRDLLRNKKKELNSMGAMDPPGSVLTALPAATAPPRRNQAVELGTINYVNITSDGRHGDLNMALQAAQAADKPIFANFVEWSG
mgnify:CR=1 FL=1